MKQHKKRQEYPFKKAKGSLLSFLCQIPDTFSDNLPAATGRDRGSIFRFLAAAQTTTAELVKGVREVLEGE